MTVTGATNFSVTQLPPTGAGGGPSPIQAPMPTDVQGAQGGGPQSPLQVPVSPAVEGAMGGEALVEGGGSVTQSPDQAQPTPPPPPVEGGGPVDPAALAPVLQQLIQVITQLIQVLQQSAAVAAANAGAAGVQGGGAGEAPGKAPAAETSSDPTAEGGGGMAGCGMAGCGGMTGAAAGPNENFASIDGGGSSAYADELAIPTPPYMAADDHENSPVGSAQGVNPGIAAAGNLKVKGRKISKEQIDNVNVVLAVGRKMGANDKVLQAAVATMIQESTIHNYNHGDRDSLGLFQQRPSQGWGTPEQVRDPKHAAKEFFRRAINNDKKHEDYSIAKLSQSVQISAFPDAYAQWEDEAARIVAAFNAGA